MAKKGEYELSIRIGGAMDKSLGATSKKVRKEIDELNRDARRASVAMQESFGNMSSSGIDGLAGISDRVLGTVYKGAKMAAVGIGAIGVASIGAGASFEAQMSTVQAISQASAGDMKRLNALAEEMGRATKFSATEAGQGLEFMAMAGWKTEEMIGGLPGIMNLAAASGEELGLVSDIVTDALTAFGLTATDSARFADVLAQASSNSNTNVAMMGDTFRYVAPVAGAFGFTIEDTATAIGLMANAGIKGEKSGTALRGMMTNLAKPSKENAKYMKELELSMTDASGEMKSFRQIIGEMRESFSGLTEAQKGEYAAGIAGKEAMSGMLALINASDADFDKLSASIDNASGSAEKMANQRIDNLIGDFTLLKSAAEGAGIEIYDGLSPVLRDITQEAITFTNGFTESFGVNFPTVRREIIQFGKDAKIGFAPILEMGEWLVDNPHVIKGSLTGIASALVTFKAAKAAKDGVKLLTTMSQTVTAWPVAVAGLAIGGIIGIGTALKDLETKAIQQNLADHFGGISLSLEELNEAARHTLGDGLFQSIDLLTNSSGKVDDLRKSMKSSIEEINKANWKISIGMELSQDEQQSYKNEIESFISNAQSYITEQQYSIDLSLNILTGNQVGEETQEVFDAFYQNVYTEANDLGIQLKDAVNTAFEDGLLTIDEGNKIAELQKQMSSITEKMSSSKFDAQMEVMGMKYQGTTFYKDSFMNLQEEINAMSETAKKSIDDALITSISSAKVMLSDGLIKETEYKSLIDQFKKNHLEQSADIELKGINFQTDVIKKQYDNEINGFMDYASTSYQTAIDETLEYIDWSGNAALGWTFDSASSSLGLEQIDNITKGAMKELYTALEPKTDELERLRQKYYDAGMEPPAALLEGLTDAASIGVLAGSENALWSAFGVAVDNNPEQKAVIDRMKQNGTYIPEQLAAAISENESVVEVPINQLYLHTKSYLNQTFGPGFDVDASIKFNLKQQGLPVSGSPKKNSGNKIGGYAEGGIVSSPEIAWIAEGGYSESVIPIDGSRKSMELWKETGRLLGAYEENNYGKMYETMTAGDAISNNSSFSPVFSPTIYISGGQSGEDNLMHGLQNGYEQFKDMMEKYERDRMRKSF